jgi:hypothetical protein
MQYRRCGARLLGLLTAAALSVMALAATAQAVTPGFLINKLPVGTLTATVGAAQEGVGTLLVPGLNFKYNCNSFTVDEGVINTNTDAKLTMLYTGCTTLSITKSPEEIACEVVEPIKAEFLALPAEMIEDKVIKEVLPVAILLEKIKALINLTKVGDLTKECILPFDNIVKGELCLKIKVGTNDTAEPLVLSNDTIQTECKERKTLEALGEEVASGGFKDKLVYGAQEVIVDGAATLKLLSPHNGKTLGVSLY